MRARRCAEQASSATSVVLMIRIRPVARVLVEAARSPVKRW
jgi:hypothetical protein